MRVLLDENLPRDLASELPGHDVDTVIGLGGGGIKNGELLRRCEGNFDALVTMDSSIEFQQRVSNRPFGVIVIQAKSSRMADLLPLVTELLSAIAALQPGEIRRIGCLTKDWSWRVPASPRKRSAAAAQLNPGALGTPERRGPVSSHRGIACRACHPLL